MGEEKGQLGRREGLGEGWRRHMISEALEWKTLEI